MLLCFIFYPLSISKSNFEVPSENSHKPLYKCSMHVRVLIYRGVIKNNCGVFLIIIISYSSFGNLGCLKIVKKFYKPNNKQFFCSCIFHKRFRPKQKRIIKVCVGADYFFSLSIIASSIESEACSFASPKEHRIIPFYVGFITTCAPTSISYALRISFGITNLPSLSTSRTYTKSLFIKTPKK